MKQEGWRRAKSSGTSGESYPLKTTSEQRGFLQPQFSQRCLCFSSTFQNFCNAVDMPLSFTLMQGKNSRGRNAITPTRLPAGSKMDLCWVTATCSLTATPNQEKTQITGSNCIVSLMPHKRIVRSPWYSAVFLLFPCASSAKFTQSGEWGRKRDGQSLTGSQLPCSYLAPTPCNETLCSFPSASFLILLILWQHQQMWHL